MKSISIIFITFSLFISCTKYIRLGNVDPASDYLNKEIIIFTKDGQIIKMRIYKVENRKLFGIDKEDNKHEILISEIRQATLLSKHDTLETCLFLGVITSFIFIGIFYLPPIPY